MQRKHTPPRFALLFILLFSSILLAAQQPLRVGVVLSGGGAKGYAHVGALKVLEEAGIRIDYIGGASAGAIVGGLYASGWSAEQLDSLLHVQNMGDLIQEHTDRSFLPFFEKYYGDKYALSLSFEDYRVTLPQALSNGQVLYDFFNALTIGVARIDDFSQLPIPFLCTGTDVSTGESVVFERGNLARAIRASGSFPGLLAPVIVDGRLIADGGILNNLPAKQVLDKGMDIIIAINVGTGLYAKDQLNSFERIIGQVSSFQTEANAREQLQYCDLIIRPDIKGYTVTSFADVDSLVRNGETAARAVWPQLLEIARQQRLAPAPERGNLPPVYHCDAPIQVDHVDFSGNTSFSERTMLEKFPVQLPGITTLEQFHKGITSLYATQNFRFIDYQFRLDSAGCTQLTIQPQLNEGYNNRLRLGLHYDQVYKTSLLLNGLFRNRIFNNSIASIDLILGDKLRYNFHYLVDQGKRPDFGFNSRLNYTDLNADLPVVINIGELALQSLTFTVVDYNNELYMNLASNPRFETGFATELKFFKTSTEQAIDYRTDDPYIDERGLYGTLKAYYHFDNRDRPAFTRTGTFLSAEFRSSYPFSSEKYDSTAQKTGFNIDFRWHKSLPVSRKIAMHLAVDAGLNLGTPAAPYRYFIGSINQNLINNFRPFVGLPFGKAGGNHLFSTSVAFQWNVYKNHYLRLCGNIAWIDEVLLPFSDGKHLYRSLGLCYSYDTPLGPIELSYGYAGKSSEVYFNLGYWF